MGSQYLQDAIFKVRDDIRQVSCCRLGEFGMVHDINVSMGSHYWQTYIFKVGDDIIHVSLRRLGEFSINNILL